MIDNESVLVNGLVIIVYLNLITTILYDQIITYELQKELESRMRNEFDDKYRQFVSEIKAQNEDRYKRFVFESSEREKILKKQFRKLQDEFNSLNTTCQVQSIQSTVPLRGK